MTAATVAASLTLAACDGNIPDTPATADASDASTAVSSPPVGDAAGAGTVAPVAEHDDLPAPPPSSAVPNKHDSYAAALADPTRYFTDIDGLDGTFTYDVLDIDGDTELELLLRAGKEGPAPVRVLKLDDGNLTATTDYLVDDAAGTYPTVFTDGRQPGLTQYEKDGTTLTVTQFALRGNRLEKVAGPQETVVGNPLSDATLIHWVPTSDTTRLGELDLADPLAIPREGTMRQISEIPELNDQSYRVHFGTRDADGRVAVTYPDLGCAGYLEQTQNGFRETITEGACDTGGTWHLLLPGERQYATYDAPTGRYSAAGPLQPAG